ncbi:MAG: EndoU domain-containing protein [Candidatus Dormiibacterota bacterium]
MSASSQPDPLFGVADRLTFRRDAQGRLRLSAPPGQEPLAAWLMGDVQENLAAADRYRNHLEEARHAPQVADRRVDGNACSVALTNGTAFLLSQYESWEPYILPWSELEAALDAMRTHLVGEVDRGWAPPERAEGCYRATVGWQDPQTGDWHERPVTDHTFFPEGWTSDQVADAVAGAATSPTLAVDAATGGWSAVSAGLHLFGYLDAGSGRPLTAFPVLEG